MSKIKDVFKQKESSIEWLKKIDSDESKFILKLLEDQENALKLLKNLEVESYNNSIIYFEIAKEVMDLREIENLRVKKVEEKRSSIVYH